MSHVTRSLLLLVGLTAATSQTSLAAPPATTPAQNSRAGKGRVRVDRAKVVDHMKRMPAADAERMQWKADISGLGPAVRTDNHLRRKGKVSVSLPGVEGRDAHTVAVDIEERVGKGSGPGVKLSLSDQTTGQDLSIAVDDEAGALRITVGTRAVEIKGMPDGSLSVDGTRCAGPEAAVAAFAQVLPQAFDLDPELVAALFVVPRSPEAGDKLLWETAIEPLLVLLKEYLVQAVGTLVEGLIGFLEFWFGAVWFEVYCGTFPDVCDDFVVQVSP